MAKRGGHPVTMADIARMAGVSESTVSRALSGSQLVAEGTKIRILELAKAANYAINEQARSLAIGETRTIEVIFPIEEGTLQKLADPFFVDMVANIADALAERGYDALLSKSLPWAIERPGCAFLGGRADGVIFVGQGRRRADIRDFARKHGRVVTWGALGDDAETCIVGTDNVEGGRLATAHLLSLGRRRIGFLGDRTLIEISQRFEGYRRALKSAGLPVDETLVLDAPFDVEGARTATRDLPRRLPGMDAIFASSDMIALGAIANLSKEKVAVPDDVAVVGFDDVAMAAHLHPSLTTVHQQIRRGSRLMVDKMMALLAGEEASPALLAPQLVIRESCGGESGA